MKIKTSIIVLITAIFVITINAFITDYKIKASELSLAKVQGRAIMNNIFDLSANNSNRNNGHSFGSSKFEGPIERGYHFDYTVETDNQKSIKSIAASAIKARYIYGLNYSTDTNTWYDLTPRGQNTWHMKVTEGRGFVQVSLKWAPSA